MHKLVRRSVQQLLVLTANDSAIACQADTSRSKHRTTSLRTCASLRLLCELMSHAPRKAYPQTVTKTLYHLLLSCSPTEQPAFGSAAS